MKVDGSLKSLLQGVSQQPARDRLPGQCTEMVNMTADPVTGLTRRPPSDYVAELGSTTSHKAFHNFETTDGRKFLLWCRGAQLRITDLNGAAYPITHGVGTQDYLGAGNGQLKFCTIDNDTYIANSSVICQMTDDRTRYANIGPASNPMAIIQVLGGQYGRRYTVRYNGALAGSYTVPNGSEAPMVKSIRTGWIALRLVEAMTETGGTEDGIDGAGSSIERIGTFAGPEWTVSRQEDVILIRRVDGDTTQFNIAVSDDMGNINIKSFTDNVVNTTDLSKYAPNGYLVRVATETDSEEDAYFKFVVPGANVLGSSFGRNGYWQETTKQDILYRFDNNSMPIVLHYNPDTSSFSLLRGTYRDRRVGTYVSNPDPTFIGGTITDVTTFQSRLVFLSGKNVIMSTSDDITDFWYSSATQVIDTDPIDISSTALEANVMSAAIPFNRDLVLFSSKGQFVIFGRSAVNSLNATLVLTTAFEADLSAKPVPSGRNIFFGTKNGRFTNIREFYTEGSTEVNDTRPISGHVKKYKVGNVAHLAASSNYDKLIVLTNQDKATIYLYEYIWSDTSKEQSAWSKWTFSDEAVYTFFDNELIYIVFRRNNAYYLYRLSLDVIDSSGLDFPIYLDGRFDVFGVSTQFALPTTRLTFYDLQCVRGEGCPNPGLEVGIESIDYNPVLGQQVVTLSEDMQGGNIVVGIKFRSSYRPTMPFVKDRDGVVISTGKLVVRDFIASLQKTGYVEAQLLSKYGNGTPEIFEGRFTGDIDNLVGEPAVVDAEWTVAFREDTNDADIEYYTDEYLPWTMLDIEWLGQYTKRGQRIGSGAPNG